MDNSATAKLELGLERLAKAGADPDLLGLALQSIHGALEDSFRAQLAADPHMPADARANVLDPKKVQWKDLLDAMVLYRDLRVADRDTIWRTNGMRTRVAHGGRYSGTRAELEAYAALVQRLCGYTPAKPASKPPARAASAQPAATVQPQPRPRPAPSAGPDIPRARRSRPAARQPHPRSRLSWLVIVGATALLVMIAVAALVRNTTSASPPAQAGQGAAPSALASAEPSAAPAATALPRSATVRAANGLRLRADHSTSAQVIDTLADGTRVTIVGGPVEAEKYAWWQVEVNGRSGWCAGDFLQFGQP